MTSPPPGEARPRRDAITMDALSVHPSLVGLPLAHPWRRAAAMTIDGVLVMFLTQAPGFLFGVAAAFVLFRASGRSAPGGYLRRSFRLTVRMSGALVLFIVAVSSWDSATERLADGLERGAARMEIAVGDEEPVDLSAIAGVQLGNDLATYVADSDRSATPADGEPAPNADSLALAYGAALEAGDTAAVGSLRPVVATALAADTLATLDGQIVALRDDRATLRQRVRTLESEAETSGIVPVLKGLSEDLGLGLGWIGLYFTATLALWQGRTPGKRLLRIRVIRLNGKPIGWWAAFERFGGYAAGFATGLLGFLQVLWDRNRQAIHDKITETAVIRES